MYIHIYRILVQNRDMGRAGWSLKELFGISQILTLCQEGGFRRVVCSDLKIYPAERTGKSWAHKQSWYYSSKND